MEISLSSSTTGQLQILGAAYGLAQVTGKIINLVNRGTNPQSLSITVSNDLFGDTWNGVVKSLTVVYRYDGGAPRVAVATEGNPLTIGVGDFKQSLTAPAPDTASPQLTVWGASYGRADVTSQVRGLISQPNQTLNLTADNATFGDTWPGVTKSFVIVASYTDQVPFVDIVTEGSSYSLKFRPPMEILSAFWGLSDVTPVVQSQISRRALTVQASNDVYGDGWPGVAKTLDVVYQYADRAPQLACAKEGETLSVDFDPATPAYHPPADPRTLNIIRAAFGPADVTAKIPQPAPNQTSVSFVPSDDLFGDSWPGVQKSCAVTYSWGPSAVSRMVAAEGQTMTIAPPAVDMNKSFVTLMGLLAAGDLLKIQTGPGDYWAVAPGGQILANATSSDGAAQFTIGIPTVQKPDITLQAPDGTYLIVGSDGTLYTGGNATNATHFVPSLLTNGCIVLSVVGTAGAPFVAVNDAGAIVASGSYTSDFSSTFTLLLNATSAGLTSHLKAHALAAEDAGLPDPLLLQVIWDLTGGFFLAIGLGPLISQQAPRTGLMNALRANARVSQALDALIAGIKNNPEASWTAAFLAFEAVIWDEGIMWTVFRLAANTAKWWAIAFALTKILEVTLLPEVWAAELTVSFGIWAYNTTNDVLAYVNSGGGQTVHAEQAEALVA